MNNKVENPAIPVPTTKAMNDCDYLNEILLTEKNFSRNYTVALNEASNEQLHAEIIKMLTATLNCARQCFNLSFKKGWYKLEKAESQKITTAHDQYQAKVKELPS